MIKEILERLRGSKVPELQKEPRIPHIGCLGIQVAGYPRYYRADLTLEEERNVEQYYLEHKNKLGISCEMDVIAVLFPKKLKPISEEEYRRIKWERFIATSSGC